jgi:hypothetical protein
VERQKGQKDTKDTRKKKKKKIRDKIEIQGKVSGKK